jgi:hypothetical protein
MPNATGQRAKAGSTNMIAVPLVPRNRVVASPHDPADIESALRIEGGSCGDYATDVETCHLAGPRRAARQIDLQEIA